MFDPNGSKVPSSKTTIEEFPLLGNKLPSVFHNPEQLCPVVLLYPSHQQSNTTQSPRVIERQRDIWVTSLVPWPGLWCSETAKKLTDGNIPHFAKVLNCFAISEWTRCWTKRLSPVKLCWQDANLLQYIRLFKGCYEPWFTVFIRGFFLLPWHVNCDSVWMFCDWY